MSVSYDDGLSALRVLKTFISAELPGEYTGDTEMYGVPRCVLEDDEPQSSDQVGGPYVLLALEYDDKSGWGTAAKRRNDVIARADGMATDFSGAQTGEMNVEGTDSLLSKALTRIIENNIGALEALGLMRPSIRAEREVIENSEAGEIHANPHRIRFTYRKS